MGKTILLTLGRLPKGLELARCLHGAGNRVIVADPFALHLSKPSRAVARCVTTPAPASDPEAYLDALCRIIREEAVDLVIPVSEEVMHVAALAGRLPETTELLCEPFERILQLHDKFEFMETAARAGLRAPPTCLGDSPGAAALAESGETVVKARFGCAGSGLHFLSAGQTLPDQLRSADWVVQRRIRGREYSTQSFCRNGEVLAHVNYRGLIFSGTVAVCFEQVALAAIDEWVSRFAEQTRYTGFVAFDFIVDADGTPWPLECNPRLTSGLHFMRHDDLAAVIMGQPIGHQVRLKAQPRYQESHTALTRAYSQALRPGAFWRMLKTMASARDVLWSAADPWVFPLMTPMSWPVLKQVIFQGRSFGDAATLDIQWYPAGPVLLQSGAPAHQAPAL
jgi:predicted ATP-grasp superfamily ATP-dependent carboligase